MNHGYRLSNHILYSVHVSRLSKCVATCLKDKHCMSVNFITSSNGLCEINEIAGGPNAGQNYAVMAGSVHGVPEAYNGCR